MSAIPFTDRELTRAWRELSTVATPLSNTGRQNSHRLLLFYAVECGLKVVWLKRQSRTLFEGADINKTGHDLRQILKDLNVGDKFLLPETFRLSTVIHGKDQFLRSGKKFGDVHQAWRYGGKCESPTDQECEQQLQKVLTWIQGELK